MGFSGLGSNRFVIFCSLYDGVYLYPHDPSHCPPPHKHTQSRETDYDEWKKATTKQNKNVFCANTHARVCTHPDGVHSTCSNFGPAQRRKLAAQMRLSVRKMTFLSFDFKWGVNSNKTRALAHWLRVGRSCAMRLLCKLWEHGSRFGEKILFTSSCCRHPLNHQPCVCCVVVCTVNDEPK